MKKQGMFFAKASKSKDRGELYIYEQIGEGYFGGVSATSFSQALRDVGAVKTIDIFINSPGGNVFDGIAIFNQLKRFEARKIVHVDALAASIASVVMMAGDEIRIAKNAQVMIHNPSTFVVGTAEEMRQTADKLDQVRDTILDTYVDRAKCDREQCQKWMDEETWMRADVAKQRGFVDIVEDEEADVEDMAFPIVAKFKNTPRELRAASLETRVLLAKMQKRTQDIRRSPAKT